MPFSKQVLDRSTGTDKIIASTTTHAPNVAAALAVELVADLAPGEVMPDFGLVLALLGRHLDRHRGAMNAADQAHQAELADDGDPRALRDEADERLHGRLVKTREVVRALFGAAGEKAAGFSGALPTNARAKVLLARTVADRLPALAGALPEGVTFDAAPAVAGLRADATTLEGHLGRLDLEAREAEATLVAKDARVAEYDRAFAGDAAVIAGFYRLAGQAELASRLRPSSRRAGITAEDAGEAEGAG